MIDRNTKNWTATDMKKLRRMYRSGRLSINQIAGRLERTYYATVKRASRACICYRWETKRKADKARKARIARNFNGPTAAI